MPDARLSSPWWIASAELPGWLTRFAPRNAVVMGVVCIMPAVATFRTTPRKDVQRNSIDLSEVEDSPRSGRVIEEPAKNKGKGMSFSDISSKANKELGKSSREFGIRSPILLFLTICPRPKEKTPTSTCHALNMQALRNHIPELPHASQLSG